MSATLNNFIKYSFTIRTLIQILYDFRTRKALDLLRIKNIDATKTRIVTITTYLVIIKSATAGTSSVIKNSSINRRKITSPRVIILIRSSTAIFYAKGSIFITFIEITSFVKETPFIVISRIIIMNEYRSSHIDIKNVIVFAFLKMKKIYDTRYQFIFFKIEDLVNLRLHKDYKIFVITSKKIGL